MTEQKSILVSAGIVVDGDLILICQRHHTDAYGMQWEFPGGKVKDGEDLKASLRRELAEELMIEAEIGAEVFRIRQRTANWCIESPMQKLSNSEEVSPDMSGRKNVAHGPAGWVSEPSLTAVPSPARAGEGCPALRDGVRAPYPRACALCYPALRDP